MGPQTDSLRYKTPGDNTMELLIAGLLLFIGGHSVKLAAPAWRTQMIARIGLLPWKGIYSLIAASGIVLMVIGYGQARIDPPWLWQPPLWLHKKGTKEK